MFMPVWMGSLVASVLLFFAFRTSNNFKIQHRIIASFGQMLLVVITDLPEVSLMYTSCMAC